RKKLICVRFHRTKRFRPTFPHTIHNSVRHQENCSNRGNQPKVLTELHFSRILTTADVAFSRLRRWRVAGQSRAGWYWRSHRRSRRTKSPHCQVDRPTGQQRRRVSRAARSASVRGETTSPCHPCLFRLPGGSPPDDRPILVPESAALLPPLDVSEIVPV